jgi:hypothetical protein
MGLKTVQLAPESWASWGTYALTLVRGGEAEKAKTALAKSRELVEKDVAAGMLPAIVSARLGYVDCWIAIKQGNKAAAQQALDKLKAALGTALTPLDQRDIKEIEAALQ